MNIDIAQYLPIIYKWGPLILSALAVFFIGKFLANKAAKTIVNIFNRSPNADPALARFIASVIKYFILIITVMIVLTILQVDTSSFSAIVLGLSAAMAFILQGTLSNIAAGVMLMIFRPFSVGDEIEVSNVNGTVTALNITSTSLKSVDNREFIIPNGQIWGRTIHNNNTLNDRRMDIIFGIDYNANIDTAIDIIIKTASAHPLVKSSPAPWAKVVNLGDSSIDIELRAWCKANDYKALKASISQPIKSAFDKASIGIPYPHETKIKQHVKTSKARDRIARLNTLRNKQA